MDCTQIFNIYIRIDTRTYIYVSYFIWCNYTLNQMMKSLWISECSTAVSHYQWFHLKSFWECFSQRSVILSWHDILGADYSLKARRCDERHLIWNILLLSQSICLVQGPCVIMVLWLFSETCASCPCNTWTSL